MRARWLIAAIAAATAAAPGTAHAADAPAEPTRYSLANGCWTLAGVAGGEKLRLQATTLGSYLLYRPDGTFLAAGPDGSVAPVAEPGPAADWKVEEAGGGEFTLSPASAPEQTIRGALTPAEGCATFPEAPLNATGDPARGATPYGRVGGIVEGHMHWMTFEYFGRRFHCGRPWHPYGIAKALPDCESIEGPQGMAAPFQNFLNFGNPAQPHDTSGYPKLTEWAPGNLTYEGTYWRWIQRVWMSGLRLMVMGVNENRVLCELQANRETNCNEMDTVRRGFKAIRELQRYADAQAGGPGRGFFQIVTDPYQAREVINAGKLAVVLEIEISEPFDCRGWDQPSCDREQIDRQLEEMYRLGVRSSLLLNKVDNPLTGVRFDDGATGLLINAANRVSAGSFWSARTCTTPLRDNTIETVVPQGSELADGLVSTFGIQSGSLPVYPPAPHCNTRGLTALGRHVVRRMMDLHMIVNPDHMSQAGVDDTLTLLESRRYSGVISPHGWMDPGNWPRLWKLGGVAFPGHSAAADYVKQWREFRPRRTPYLFGWGYGADLGGLSHQPVGGESKVTYPFKSYDGKVTFDRQTTGERTFDYVKEGVSHYGLYADWLEDLRRIGGAQLARDMWNGAEAYLQMWERADGVAAPGFRDRRGSVTRRGLGDVRLGVRWRALLRSAGQPQQRGRAWSWCVKGRGNGRAADVAVLSPGGIVQLVGSTARGRAARGVRVGDRHSGRGLVVRSAGGRRAFVALVRGGRVKAVAVTTRRLAGDARELRGAMARVQRARPARPVRRFVPARAQAGAAGALTGRILAGTSSPSANAVLALLCSLPTRGA